MKFFEICKSVALGFVALFPSPFSDYSGSQEPLGLEFSPEQPGATYDHPPVFDSPNGPDTGPPFTCKYPALGNDWTDCSTPNNRGCWLKHKNGTEYNLTTDYETVFPPGVTREYYLELDNLSLNADGVTNTDGKLFNGTYPGPWIQACWGDLIKITVKNNLRCNGTSIHWHGIRQLNTVEMDGVNGVTQCPIAPSDSFTYTFRAWQYGTTWYHSHYSLQYADGLVGPMTIYGPSSGSYDEARDPILITDWSHRSAFKDYVRELTGVPGIPKMNSVLINGKGNFAGEFDKDKFSMHIEKGKKYLLRIINTSVDTTYVFSIDNHQFSVISSDFVPIVPYNTSSITVGIGQRYHIILDATPIPNNGWLSASGNYWLRAIPAIGCAAFETGNDPDERQGIVRYNASNTDVPVSWRAPTPAICQDEPYDKLTPILPWNVTPLPLPERKDWFRVGLQTHPGRPAKEDNFAFWTIGDEPLWLDYARPTIHDLDNTTWSANSVVIEEDYPPGSWVYLVITMPTQDELGGNPNRRFIPTAHPIHLHGHDFALLAQGTNRTLLPNVPLRFTNPPRRDVALLPSGGYLIIAFKADNPGIWLMHCHIAWHASSGLALQIMERRGDLRTMLTPKRMEGVDRTCDRWARWYKRNEKKCVQPPGAPFQDDSGI